jgi:hypothetical protein
MPFLYCAYPQFPHQKPYQNPPHFFLQPSLNSLMGVLNPSLPEAWSLLSGLKEDIRPMLKILNPANVMQAFNQTK